MLSNSLSNLDVIGPLPTLRVQSKTRYKTALGGILSILAILSVLGLSGYFITDTINRDTMNVIFTDRKNQNPTFNFFDTFVMFDMVDYLNRPHPNILSIVTPRIILRTWAPAEQKMYEKSLPLNSNCEKAYGNIWPQFAGLNTVPYQQLCFDHTKTDIPDFELTPLGIPSGFNYTSLQIWKCDNKTSDIPCASDEEIEAFLSFSYMGLRTINYAIENDNVTDVNQPYTETMVFEFSSDLYRRYDIQFNKIEYTTDTGYVFEELVTKKFAITGEKKTIVSINPPLPGVVGEFFFYMSNARRDYKRSYMTCQSFVANIGGAVKGVMIT